MVRTARQFVRRSGGGWLVGTSLVARAADLTVALPVVLLVVAATGSYAWAGLVTGAMALGTAVATPPLARLADRRGHRPVLAGSAAVSGLLLVLLGLAGPHLAGPGLVALGLLLGLTSPPFEASVRAIVARTERPAGLQRLLAIDSTAQELVFIAAPPVHVAVSQLASPSAAVLLAAATLIAGTVAMVASPRAGIPPETRSRTRGRGALSSPTVRLLALVGLFSGVYYGMTSIGLIARADELGMAWLAAPFTAVWALGSLVGGTYVVLRPSAAPPAVRMRRLLVVSAALAAPVAVAAADPWVLVAALLVQGVTVAPAVTAHAETLAAAAPRGMSTEAFAWATSATVVGYGIGDIAGGSVVEAVGGTGALAAAAMALGLAAMVARRGTVAPPRAVVAAPAEAGRPRAGVT